MYSLLLVPWHNPETINLGTVWDFLVAGGPVMVPIGICSVAAMGLAFERLINLRQGRVLPRRIDEALDHVRHGRDGEALAVCEELNAPAGRILAAGLRRRGFLLDEVERAMEDQGGKEMERMQARVRGLSLIANVAPLLGLLGTVTGILAAFRQAARTGLGKPEQLAGGIEEALITTVAGLVVAIPVLLLAAWFSARMRRFLAVTDERLAPAVEWLSARTAPAPAPKPEEKSHAA